MAAHKSRRAPLADLGLLGPRSWIPGFQNCEKTHFYCLNHSAYGVLLWQPVLTNTWLKKKKMFFLVIFFRAQDLVVNHALCLVIIYICSFQCGIVLQPLTPFFYDIGII